MNMIFLPRALFVALIVCVDQGIKWFMTTRVLGDSSLNIMSWFLIPPQVASGTEVVLAPFCNMIMVLNRGVSFGMLSGSGDMFLPLVLSFVTLCVIGVLAIWLTRTPPGLQGAALVLIIGGALGNVVDRLRLGVVIDFVDVHVAGWHWPAFNFADATIVVGVCLIVLATLIQKGSAEK